MIINNSRADTYTDCSRKYYWSYVHGGTGLRPQRSNDNLIFGEITHAALARMYSGEEIDDVLQNYRPDALALLDFDNLDFDVKNKWLDNLDQIDSLVRAYDKWRQDNDTFSVLQVETEGFVKLGETCYQCGRPYQDNSLDAAFSPEVCIDCDSPIHYLAFRADLAVNDGGIIRIVDHKTAASAGALYLESWHYSMQMLGYVYGYGKALGTNVGGYIVNILRKLKTLDKTTKQCPTCRNGVRKRVGCVECGGAGSVGIDPPVPFSRESESVPQVRLDMFVQSRIGVANAIGSDQTWTPNYKACFARGKCQFLALCWNNPGDWQNPPDSLLLDFELRPADYVDTRALIKEEMD